MARDLRTELRQTKPFSSLEQEAYLGIVRTAVLLMDGIEQLLKPHGITGTQYNVLRILRGAEPNGLCRNEVRDRMLTRMPDVTRLLDRMEENGLIARERSDADRRQVSTRITERGRKLLEGVEDSVLAEHERRLSHLGRTQLRTLNDLLSRVREGE